MRARLLDTAEEFLDATLDLRAAGDPAGKRLGSVASDDGGSLRRKCSRSSSSRGGDGTGQRHLLAGLRRTGCSAARWTAWAAHAQAPLAHAVAGARGRHPRVVAPLRVAEVVAAGVGGVWSTTMRERILVLHDYLVALAGARAPVAAPRTATLDLLVRVVPRVRAEGLTRHRVRRVIRRNRSLAVAGVDGVPVSSRRAPRSCRRPSAAISDRCTRRPSTATALRRAITTSSPRCSGRRRHRDVHRRANPTSNGDENLGLRRPDDMVVASTRRRRLRRWTPGGADRWLPAGGLARRDERPRTGTPTAGGTTPVTAARSRTASRRCSRCPAPASSALRRHRRRRAPASTRRPRPLRPVVVRTSRPPVVRRRGHGQTPLARRRGSSPPAPAPTS